MSRTVIQKSCSLICNIADIGLIQIIQRLSRDSYLGINSLHIYLVSWFILYVILPNFTDSGKIFLL